MKKILFVLISGLFFSHNSFADIVFRQKLSTGITINSVEPEMVNTAVTLLSKDYEAVFSAKLEKKENGPVFVGTLGYNSTAEKMLSPGMLIFLRSHSEGFVLEVKNDKLLIVGSDKRGTAYGLMEVSRLLGVSPWEWWADSKISAKDKLILKNGMTIAKYPSVPYRGIFINDEDWGLNPWSYKNFEPSNIKGQIGPKTHARIFELLLRLRANIFWPAMHSCTVAFYSTPRNKEMADKYGIIIGTSHCEPMMRNTYAEWNKTGKGAYDYVHNREEVLNFWEERVHQLAGSDNIYTIGMRGLHDSKMQGANTVQEQKDALTNVLKDQRDMLARYVNKDVEKVPQVFIPYKEVLDVYKSGLQVPDDVTLLWCDDNYGYISHFPTENESKRMGGNGVYYHVSYWGRPHDYLWLATNHPAQLYTQMKMAFDKGAKKMWILNVGDIKPAEYLTELFLDMAWDIKSIDNCSKGIDLHLYNWLCREFGNKLANKLLPVMTEYYRLAYIRKPEFMGGTRTEEKDPRYKEVADLPWTKNELYQRIRAYSAIADKVVKLSTEVPSDKKDAWFELIEYPVRAAAEMNKKHLYGQLARHGLANWQKSDQAYDTILSLTAKYNEIANSKWKYIMDYKPRNLAVFDQVSRGDLGKYTEPEKPVQTIDASLYKFYEGQKPVCHGLGYNRKAIALQKNSSVTYRTVSVKSDSILIVLALAPNHPVNGKTIRYSISIDNSPATIVDYRTQDRNEKWKLNVLSNQALCTTIHSVKPGKHSIKITALDEGVIVDQIKLIAK